MVVHLVQDNSVERRIKKNSKLTKRVQDQGMNPILAEILMLRPISFPSACPPLSFLDCNNAYRNAKCACMISAFLCLHVDELRHECEQSVLKNTKLCD